MSAALYNLSREERLYVGRSLASFRDLDELTARIFRDFNSDGKLELISGKMGITIDESNRERRRERNEQCRVGKVAVRAKSDMKKRKREGTVSVGRADFVESESSGGERWKRKKHRSSEFRMYRSKCSYVLKMRHS